MESTIIFDSKKMALSSEPINQEKSRSEKPAFTIQRIVFSYRTEVPNTVALYTALVFRSKQFEYPDFESEH